MNSYIALLRGINVSGKNVMKMADLKNALSPLNLEYLQTYFIDVKKLYYINLFGSLSSEDFDKLIERDRFSEEMVLGKTGQIIYVLYNNGYGRSKLTHRYFENKLKVFVTARNHNTMTKLDFFRIT
ncbi:MAG: DUF1697 domain-containing protein [Flavobacteriaceae bacterium]|nr:MAG: DUF1697 domain-containing protein [Flavobacteriaceae bacterium]